MVTGGPIAEASGCLEIALPFSFQHGRSFWLAIWPPLQVDWFGTDFWLMGCKQKWCVQLWAVPLKERSCSPFSLAPGWLDGGPSVRRPTPPPRAWAPEDFCGAQLLQPLGLLYGTETNLYLVLSHCYMGLFVTLARLGIGALSLNLGLGPAHLNSRDWKRRKSCSPRNMGILLPGKCEMSSVQANNSPYTCLFRFPEEKI